MLTVFLFLAQAAAAPVVSPTPAASSPAPALGNAPQATVAAPTPAGPRTLADVARERKLNANGAKSGTMSVSSTRGAAALPEAAPAPKPGSPGDQESQWRGRASRLRSDLAQAEDALQRAEAENPIVYLRNGGISAAGMAARNAALTPYRLRVQELEAELARLPEECRTTPGCSPGWIR